VAVVARTVIDGAARTAAQPLYYGIDQLGSVGGVLQHDQRDSQDPYGLPLQETAPITDFVYGGMVYNADSGLYLTNYRAFDPIAGRWLSGDPLGESIDPLANLYTYVRNSRNRPGSLSITHI
jgi:RHS repeat-associated protein